MRGFEEIQKIVKNFVEESKQAKQQIIDIENERNNLAQERNEKKEANIQENLAKINELGKQISKLGNQSQELQNKLDKRFFEVKKLVNLMIDNKITEEMRKIRKINEVKEEYMEKIALKEERNAKYEIQKQEFFERFGRMPELSENAKKEDAIQDKQCEKYREKAEEKQIQIEKCQENLAELVEFKNAVANKDWAKIICDKKENEEEIVELPLVEEIEIEEIEPIQEVEVEEFQPIEEISIEELEIEPFEEIKEENSVKEDSIISKNIVEESEKNEIDQIEELAKAIVEQIVAEQTEQINKNISEEKEIITFEEKNTEKYDEVLNEPVVLSNIMVKIENNELVYKAQASNGEEVSIKPTKLVTGNALLKIKEEIEKVKEILINYAVVEYKPLDKSVIKKIDPLVCELLNKFANKYNYDAEMLIYNYAMSFAKNEMLRTDFVSITYNIAYIDVTNLSKLEKREITKICKKSFKNENVDIIGGKSTFSGIKYIFKRLFAINSENRLPEGKY